MECIQCIGLALVPASGSCGCSAGTSKGEGCALIPGKVLRIGGSLRGKRLPGGCPGDGKRQRAGPCDFSPPPLACPRPAVGSRRAAPARAALHGRAGSRLRQLHPPRGREQQPPAPGRVSHRGPVYLKESSAAADPRRGCICPDAIKGCQIFRMLRTRCRPRLRRSPFRTQAGRTVRRIGTSRGGGSCPRSDPREGAAYAKRSASGSISSASAARFASLARASGVSPNFVAKFNC